jgi:uncharacterized protein (TIGR00255 family)
MVLSMTGYGKAVTQLKSKKITAEVKAVNSKQLDLMLRLPSAYREKELEIREILAREIIRGKVDLGIYVEMTGEDDVPRINSILALAYIRQLEDIKKQASIDGDSLSAAMRMPDVLRVDREELSEEEWLAVQEVIRRAINAFISFRVQEGRSIELDFESRIDSIRSLLSQIAPFEAERLNTVKERMLKNLEGISIDQNRFEQELIFYIEKLDVNEEKIRLLNHLDYFLEVMKNEDHCGRKLGFIGQEIGREINTLGSKANHAEIQKRVVQMKEDLERIKEQVANAL